MPPLNLLLLPLMGGFLFATCWYPTKFYTLRADGYKLIFSSAIAGSILLLLASVLVGAVWTKSLSDEWRKLVPLQDSGKSVLALLMGATLWIPINYIANIAASKLSIEENQTFAIYGVLGKFLTIDRAVHSSSSISQPVNARRTRKIWCIEICPSLILKPLIKASEMAAINRAINDRGDPVELMLRNALYLTKMVSVTLGNGKIYRGDIVKKHNPAFPRESIDLFLDSSGYREQGSLLIFMNVDYNNARKAIAKDYTEKALEKDPSLELNSPLLEKMAEEKEEEMRKEFTIAIPYREVQSINFFNKDLYATGFGRG